jgi:hypothetical protein
VSDIFHEVDEEVRREQLKKLWERYQNYIVALLLLIIIGVGAWRTYEWWADKRAAEMGTAFEAAIALGDQGKHAEAAAAFGKIADQGASGYRSLARMRQAEELSQSDPKQAVSAYDQIAADGSIDPVLRDLAALRAGAMLMDIGSLAEARQKLEPLTEPGRSFRHTARELLAFAAWRAGDTAQAKRWLGLIMTDAETPASIRARGDMLTGLMAAEGKG